MDKIGKIYEEDLRLIFVNDLPWGVLSGQKVLVTGATGLIGGCLVDALMLNPQKDYDVYASGRDESRARRRFGDYFDDLKFHFLVYDVLNPLDSNLTFDYIIHAASYADPKLPTTTLVFTGTLTSDDAEKILSEYSDSCSIYMNCLKSGILKLSIYTRIKNLMILIKNLMICICLIQSIQPKQVTLNGGCQRWKKN